jgi:glycosyltransferase involved in cell wall biosynthesis
MPLFSVVIPTYNRKDLLRRALQSVMRQRCHDFEVIVIDDGSTDGTEAMVAEFDKVRFFRQHRLGPGAARNLAWEQANGEFLAFLDSDDLWFPWTLETFKRCIEEHRRPALVTVHYFPFCDDQRVHEVTPETFASTYYPDYFASADEGIWLGAAGMLVRRDCCARFPTDMKVAEDIHLALQLGLETGFVAIRSPYTFAYRYHGLNSVANYDNLYAGFLHLVHQEKACAFPGGRRRQGERRALITRSMRRVCLNAIERARLADAVRLYWETLPWQIALGRWRFVVGLPLLALKGLPTALFGGTAARKANLHRIPDSFASLSVSERELVHPTLSTKPTI